MPRRGLGGIVTCDMVVDGSGNAVDCSLWSNIFNTACWNPVSPCAAAGSVDGQPAVVDNSLSQLGATAAGAIEGTPGQSTVDYLGSPAVWMALAFVGVAALYIFGGKR